MKALLLKDFLTLSATVRIIILIMIVMACIPTVNMTVFFMVYCVMLPVNALAYDERTKWDVLSAMMPYRPWQLVISKYVLGYAVLGVLTALAMITKAVYLRVTGMPITANTFLLIALYAASTTIVLSIVMPLVFRFGVEKGRLALAVGYGIGIGIFVGLIAPLSNNLEKLIFTPLQLIALVIAVTLLANGFSMLLSTRIYRRRHA